jgi:DNA-binding LacI/PurR family transcriptional regulator
MRTKALQSIYELADELGVSTTTVSRVLNGRPGIGEATRKRVLSVARRARFRPRMTARQVTVAVVIDRHQFATFGGFVSSLLSHLVQMLAGQDVAVELVTERNLDRLHERLIDGVLAMAWDDSTIEAMRKLPEIPVVTLNRMDVADFSAVATDHRAQADMAVQYLYSHGHRRIAMVCEERDNWGSRQRVEGFNAAFQQAGLTVDEQAIVFTDHQPTYGVLRRLMSSLNPTAIFVAAEDLDLEVSYILRDVLGLRVPEDVSVVGMESSRVSQFLAPPMTTLCQPLEELANKAMALLLQQMAKGARSPEQVVLPNTLIERESVATLAEPK